MRLVLAVACLLCLSLSCSDDPTPAPATTSPASVSKTVGPDGADMVVGGATVTIPPGALGAPVPITITASDEAPPAGFVALSRVFKCEPSGTTFAQPVTMEMPFTDDGLPKTMFWSAGGNPTFNDVGGTAVDGKMKATVTHFSEGFIGRKEP